MSKNKYVEKDDFSIKHILIILMIVALVLIVFYLINLRKMHIKEKTSESYLIKNKYVTNSVNSILELKHVLKESPNKLILMLSYHHSNKMYNIEKKIAKEIKNYDVQDIMYIYDFTSIKEKTDHFQNVINDSLDINVTDFPVIIYYEDGQISSYKIIKNGADIKSFFKKYNIEKK